MKSRKHMTEFALLMNMTHSMLLQQDDLPKVAKTGYFSQEYPCHIYFICRRPRITLNPSDFKIENGKMTLPFQIQRKEKIEKVYIKVPYKGDSDIKLVSEYPYNFYKLKQRNGTILREGKAAVFFQNIGYKNQELFDLEILYIGQSYGVEGSRTAPDRLKNHSTLQGIYLEALSRNPDNEIWLLLTSFEQILVTSIDGTMKATKSMIRTDDAHSKKVTTTVLVDGLKEQQVINFTEAALIRYFQPTYNIEYKETFPNPAHTTYSECYELDVNSVCIELDTENINCRLFSSKTPARWCHVKEFFLHSSTDRKSIFEYANP